MSVSIPTPVFFISASVNGSSHNVKDGVICAVYTHNASSPFEFSIKSSQTTVDKQVNYQTKKAFAVETIQEWVDNYYAKLAEDYTTYTNEAEAQEAIEAGFVTDAAK